MPAATLETLFNNMGPTFAASAAGQTLGQEQGLSQLEGLKRASDLQKAQQDYEQANLMNPLLLQAKGADVAHTQALTGGINAETPGKSADSRSKTVAANIAENTAKSKEAAVESAHRLQVAKDKVDFLNAHHSELVDAASQISAGAAAAPGGGDAARQQLLSDERLSPETRHLLETTPVEKLPDMVKQIADYRTKATADFIKEHFKQTQETGRAIEGHQISANAQLGSAQIHANATIEAARMREQAQLHLAETKRTLSSAWLAARNAGNAELANDIERVMQTANATYGTAVDLPGATGGAIGRNASPKPGQAQHSLADLRAMYPGKSDDEIKKAYKAKFNVEPK